MKLPKVGDVIAVEFLDHGTVHTSPEELYNATTYGRVWKVTDTELILDNWHPTDPEADRHKLKEANGVSSHCLAMGAIRAWYPLRKGRRTS
jgi:hypothetical protein